MKVDIPERYKASIFACELLRLGVDKKSAFILSQSIYHSLMRGSFYFLSRINISLKHTENACHLSRTITWPWSRAFVLKTVILLQGVINNNLHENSILFMNMSDNINLMIFSYLVDDISLFRIRHMLYLSERIENDIY